MRNQSARLLTRTLALILLSASALSLPSAARADDDEGGYYDEEPEDPKTITLSMSPLHLLIPMFEAQAELRLGSWLGVSVLGGGGSIPAETTGGDKLHFKAWELGGQVVAYPSQVFTGLQLGAEVLYMHVSIDEEIGSERVSGLGAGLAMGPFIGYKWISDPGFTVFIQGGFTVLVMKADAKNDLGQSATRKENELLLLLNVNLGWSI